MDADDDHYRILGLPSGYEGIKLSLKDIEKAYRSKARTTHPDKNPNDPLAKSKFQKLQSSFQILKNDTARKALHDLLLAKLERLRRDSNLGSKRRRMVSDLEARERAAEFDAADPSDKLREEEERARKKFQEEIAKIREMFGKKEDLDKERGSKEKGKGEGLDKERILKVSWEKGGQDYDAERLRELFGRFGQVEDVVIHPGAKKRRSALVVMGSKEAVMASKEAVEEDYKRFEESLENEDKKDESKDGNTKAIRVGIMDWWTKSKYAYLNQPTLQSMDKPKGPTTYIPNMCFYTSPPSQSRSFVGFSVF